MPDTVSDLEYVRSYVTACERLRIEPLYALICASLSQHSNVPAWLLALRDDCEPLGIDVIYNSGSYSFINGAYSSGRADVRAFLDAHLNSKGLFESIVRAEEFIEIYQSVIDAGANLETLDGASTVMLWEDVDLSLLRRILAGG